MLLQIDTLTTDTLAMMEGAVEEATQSINLFTMAQYGGWIMIVLALLLAWAVYIFIERMVVISAAGKDDKSFMDRIRDFIHEGDIDSALKLSRTADTPASRMIEVSRVSAVLCKMYK